ncbi:MAG: T9SS type A sorting domain-containing protein [Bacteroidia bacterium]
MMGYHVERLVRLSLIIPTILVSGALSAQTISEILGRPTDSTITMSILFDQKAEVYWEYGTESGNYTSKTANYLAEAEIPLEMDFTKLLPDRYYYYRTRYKLSGSNVDFKTGAEHSFHTQRILGSTYTFTIEADEHLYDKKGVNSIYQICLNNQADDHPDFMFSLGDTFGNDHEPFTITSEKMKELHRDYRPLLGSICHSIPFYFCLGNHEGEFDYYLAQTPPNNIAVYGTIWRKFYYPNPVPNSFYSGNNEEEPFGMGKPENYYAFTWGDVLFVVLDVYRYQNVNSAKPQKWDWTLGKTQYDWLKNTLETSQSKYKFVLAHHTRGEGRGGAATAKFYEWGGYEEKSNEYTFAKNRPGWEKPIHQLFTDTGVNIFFQGHDHLFAKEDLDGIVYQEVPMPSDSTYEIGMLANADSYVSNQIEGTGHLRVTVSPENVKVDFVQAWLPADTSNGIHQNQEVAFSYTVTSKIATTHVKPESDQHFQIYPNPANDNLTIKLTNDIENFQFRLISMQGQQLLQTTEKQIDVSKIPNGIYLANIRTEKNEFNERIIINHVRL